MICSVCYRMLRGQDGRQWRGTFDLHFAHHRDKSGLVMSAEMGCCICRALLKELLLLPFEDATPNAVGQFVTAFLSAVNAHSFALEQSRAGRRDNSLAGEEHKSRFMSLHGRSNVAFLLDLLSLYRLDFKLNDSRKLGSFLLRPTEHNRESRLYTPVSRHTAENEVFELARYWIRRCNGHQHPDCRDWDRYRGEKCFLPTRLVELPSVRDGDLGTSEDLSGKSIKLVETSKLLKAGQSPALYVTLSHRWGNATITRLLKKNESEFLKGISFDALPQTFKDAMNLAARLERNRIRYIWIDSLCIIQDDPDDWLRESVTMFQIYANSYCNISATAAIDATQGLFFPRDPHNLWEDEVNVNTDGLLQERPSQKRTKLPRGYSPQVRRCEVFDLAFWSRLVEKSPVNRRAWVLQERLLAPRVLHFCEDQIAWECPEHDAAESYPDGLPRLELKAGNIEEKIRLKSLLSYQHQDNDFGEQLMIDPEQTSEAVHEYWKLIVERYSTTGLSHESDKLIALAGMAQLMANRIRGRYVAGMWEKYLASQLAWRVKTAYKNGRLLYPSRRPKEYRAPTFSWASIDAPQGVECSETQREKEVHVSVSKIHVRTQTDSPFGPLKKAQDPDTSDVCYIDIDCMMTPVKIELQYYEGSPRYHCKFYRTQDRQSNKLHSTRPETARQLDIADFEAKSTVGVYLDCPQADGDDLRKSDAESFCLPASTSSTGDLICLLIQRMKLQQKGATKELYRRVGLLTFPAFLPVDQEEILEQARGHPAQIRPI